MEKAKQEILEVVINGQRYLYSLVEKQNDSAIMFNDRILFLIPDKCIGYVSDTKATHPEYIPFQKAKVKIPIENVKGVLVNEKQLKLKYYGIEQEKRVEKSWLLRMAEELLTKKWKDKIQFEKTKETVKRLPPKPESAKLPEPQSLIKKNTVRETVRETQLNQSRHRQTLSFSRTLEISQNPRALTSSKQIGISAVQPYEQKSSNLVPYPKSEMKQFGTIMSQRSGQSRDSLVQKPPPKPVSRRDVNVGTSILEEEFLKQDPIKEEESPAKPEYTDRSLVDQAIANKTMRSQPAGKRQQPYLYDRRSEMNVAQQHPQKVSDNIKKQEIKKEEEPKKQNYSIVIRQDVSSRKAQNNSVVQTEQITFRKDPLTKNSEYNKSVFIQNKGMLVEEKQDAKSQQPVLYVSRSKQQVQEPPKERSVSVKKQEKQKNSAVQNEKKNEVAASQVKKQQKKEIQPTPAKTIKNFQEQSEDKNQLSNVKYISPEQYEKMNLSQSYYERTNKLIHPSSKSINDNSQFSNSSLNHPETQTLREEPNNQFRQNRSQQMQNAGKLGSKNNNNNGSVLKPANNADTRPKLKSISPSQQIQSQNKLRVNPPIMPIKQKQSIKQQQKQSVVNDLEQIPWVFKYIKSNELIFEDFISFTKDLLEQLIEDIKQPKEKQRYPHKIHADGIRHFIVNDIEVKIATINLTSLSSEQLLNQKICSKQTIKSLQNQFNNFTALYQYLGINGRIRVPLVCLNQINGFIGLFKIIPHPSDKQIRMREFQQEFTALKQISKIDYNFYQNYQKQIVLLDQEYYQQFKDPKNQYDTNINYDIIFLQQINSYLLPDLATDLVSSSQMLLRKELLERYARVPISAQSQNGASPSKLNNKKIEQISQNVFKAISQAIMEVDNLQAFFFSSGELSNYLHGKGINLRYLSHLYECLKLSMQKEFVMTEMAVRSCKSLFRKALQDFSLQKQHTHDQTLTKICEFLNCVVGDRVETGSIWKLLSNHSKNYFGIELSLHQVNPTQFIVSLIESCRLQVDWNNINIDEAFKSNHFFNPTNLIGLKPKHKIYPPIYNDLFQNCLKIVSAPESEEGFHNLMQDLVLESNRIPGFMVDIEQKIRKYLSFFIDPTSAEQRYSHLNLYFELQSAIPSRFNFEMKLVQIKWLLKMKNKNRYLKCSDDFINKATKFFGEFHPIFSQLYDTFSVYHLSVDNFDDAITFAKSSLVNILKICGTQHQKTAQSYYNLALCYFKANRLDEALTNFKKAKQIFQDHHKTGTFSFGVISLKLSLLHLNQSKIEDSLKCALKSLTIFQKLNVNQCQQQLAECYESLTRCYQVKQNKQKLRQISKQVYEKLHFVQKQASLQKLLKVYMYPFLIDLSSDKASNYIDLITQLNTTASAENYTKAFQMLKERVGETIFQECLIQYLKKINIVGEYISRENVIDTWHSFSQTYDRETVNDCISLTEELIVFLGEGFINGALRQAL